MNEENNIAEYFSKLPVSVQDCVTSAEWKERFGKIVSKYALNKEQSSGLHLEILLVLVGVEPEKDITENIKSGVGVSGLLAEQLVIEIQDRIFSWIDKVYESKNTKTEIPDILNETISQTIIKKTISEAENDILEIRPEITPMIEPEEKVHIVTPPTPKPFISESIPQPSASSLRESAVISPEITQKPVSVPRYTGDTIINPQSPKSTEPQKPPEPVAPAVKNYVVDPYREPLE